MTPFGLPRALSSALIASFGLSFLLAGATSSVKAGTVTPGTDYLTTPPTGARYLLPSGNFVWLDGFSILSPAYMPIYNPAAKPDGTASAPLPTGPDGGYFTPNPPPGYRGLADTVVNRLNPIDTSALNTLNTPRSIRATLGAPPPGKNADDCPLLGGTDPAACVNVYKTGGETNIEIVGLSLQGSFPQTFGGTTYTNYVGLQKYYPAALGGGTTSTGKMFIGEDPSNTPVKFWDSVFTVNAMGFFVPNGSPLDTTIPDFVRKTLMNITSATDSMGNAITSLAGPFTEPFSCTYTDPSSSMTTALKCLPFIKPNFIATNEPWDTQPTVDTLTGDNYVPTPNPAYNPQDQTTTPYLPQDFYLLGRQVPHDAGDGTIHQVSYNWQESTQACKLNPDNPYCRILPVPAPLPILGVSAAFASIGRMKKFSSLLRDRRSISTIST